LASGSADTTVLVWDMPALVPPRRPAAGGLSAGRLKGLWADLAAEDAAHAYQAIAVLADHPGQAGPFLREALKQSPVAEGGKRLARLIADLDADDFQVREKASEELARLGRLAEPALKGALQGRPSPEVARRVRSLLGKLDGKGPPPESLRAVRTVEALERIGTRPAREALQALADHSADPSLAREARASLRRLAVRP
jgi:hypothetical protein